MHKYLLQNKLFQKLPSEQLAELENLCVKILLPENAVLISEGDDSYDLFVVVKGELTILKESDDGSLFTLGKKKSGDIIGELAFIESGLRSATVKTLTPCELIKIDGEKIRSKHQYENLLMTS